MTDWIGRTFTSETGWTHLETLVDIGNRMAGSDGERRAAEATADTLEAVGARSVEIDEFDIQGWARGSATIRAGGRSHECQALPRSPAAEHSGPLVDVGHGIPDDFDRDLAGAVVMAASNVPSWHDRFVHRREKYYRAVDAGAAAFIFRNHVPGQLAPTGSVGTDDRPIGEIPAVGVSKEVGARLARQSGGDDSDPVTVAVDADIHEATSQNVHAAVGPATDEAVLVTSHVDAHDIAEGAMDNGAGTATLVEVASALVDREADLDTRVRFIAFGAEEVGLRGAGHEAAQTDPDAVTAVVNLDGVVRGRTLSFTTHGFPDLASAVETVADRFDHPLETKPRLGPHSDHWPFVVRGIPGYHVSSVTGDEGRGWGHTAADTIDKLESRDLRESAILLTDLVVHLAREGVTIPRRSTDEIAADLEAQDLAAGMKLVGEWPF